MLKQLFAVDLPNLPTKKNSDVRKKNEIPAKLLGSLDIEDVFALSFTCKFFKAETKTMLDNLSLPEIENRITEQLKKIAVFAKELQTRKPFLIELKLDEINNENIYSIKQKSALNQIKLNELLEERTKAYWFLASIPAAMSLSFISYSIGFSLLKNLMLIYQSLAGMWVVLDNELTHIKVPLIGFLTSSALDKLEQSNANLILLCNAWMITHRQQESISNDHLTIQLHQQ